MNAQEILSIIEQNKNKFNYFGLRAMTPNPNTNEVEVAVIGEPVQNSYHWVDGNSTGEEAGGVCALSLNYDWDNMTDAEKNIKVNNVINEIKLYAWCTNQVVLLASMRREFGVDQNEVILSDNDTVLKVWEI